MTVLSPFSFSPSYPMTFDALLIISRSMRMMVKRKSESAWRSFALGDLVKHFKAMKSPSNSRWREHLLAISLILASMSEIFLHQQNQCQHGKALARLLRFLSSLVRSIFLDIHLRWWEIEEPILSKHHNIFWWIPLPLLSSLRKGQSYCSLSLSLLV